jgi:hypothetical protein
VAGGALEGSLIVTATVEIGTPSSNVGGGKRSVILVTFGNSRFMGKKMQEQSINGERLHTSGDRGHKWVIFRTQTAKEIGSEFLVADEMTSNSKSGDHMLDLVIII